MTFRSLQLLKHSMYSNKGFTLIELLVVIAIIGILSSIVLASLSSARDKAKIARAQADLSEFQKALALLENDSGETINHLNLSGCPGITDGPNNEFYLDTEDAGLLLNDSSPPYLNWDGPYISAVTPDPWGNQYIYDEDFQCIAGATGCDGYPTSGHVLRVLHSGGPNGSGINGYDSDNVVIVLCER